MQYVNLGNTGLRVSRICLGMMSYGAHAERPWALPETEAEPIIRRAVEGGITFFDTADVYNGGVIHEENQPAHLLILDTEVYSNTGGQASKATPRGAVAKGAGAPTQHLVTDVLSALATDLDAPFALRLIDHWANTTDFGDQTEPGAGEVVRALVDSALGVRL